MMLGAAPFNGELATFRARQHRPPLVSARRALRSVLAGPHAPPSCLALMPRPHASPHLVSLVRGISGDGGGGGGRAAGGGVKARGVKGEEWGGGVVGRGP